MAAIKLIKNFAPDFIIFIIKLNLYFIVKVSFIIVYYKIIITKNTDTMMEEVIIIIINIIKFFISFTNFINFSISIIIKNFSS